MGGRVCGRRAFSDIPSGRVVVVDGLAASALPGVLELHAARLRLVMLVHLPIAADVGLDEATAAAISSNRSARSLASAALVLVTGAATLPLLAEYAVAADRVSLVGARHRCRAGGPRHA